MNQPFCSPVKALRSVLDAVNRQLSFLPQPTGRPGPG